MKCAPFSRPHLAAQAAFDGWNEKAVLAAADLAGVDTDLARLAFNEGPVDMIDAWFQAVDEKMAAKYSADELAGMKIRERIKALVEARLEALGGGSRRTAARAGDIGGTAAFAQGGKNGLARCRQDVAARGRYRHRL